MSHHTLSEFITAARAKGASDEFLRSLLIAEGWPQARVNAAFTELYVRETGIPIPPPPPGVKEAARDAFLYLLSFLTLVIWTIALGSMLFTFIDLWRPDLGAYTGRSMRSSNVSGEIASILIAMPVFFYVARLIGRDIRATPEKLGSPVRAWITYVALFFAAGISIADLIVFLTALLDGSYTVQFILRVLVVLAIAGGVFWYYLGEMRRRPDAPADDA